MAVEAIEQKQEAAFDPKAFMEARNRGAETPKAAEPKVEPKADEPEAPRLPRSVRREMNRLHEQLGAERARRELLEASGKPAEKPVEVSVEDPEPQRKSFPAGEDGAAQWLRETQKWDRRQEAKEKAGATAQAQGDEQFETHLRAMDTKAAEDIKTLSDWDEVLKASQEDDDAPEFDLSEHKTFAALLSRSDMRAFVLYHFAKNPDALQKMLDLTKTPNQQIGAFHRLEGRLEKEYGNNKAAQATDPAKEQKDRKHLAEAARPGETATGANPVKPKPSSEVAARGGSPAPDEPAIGTPAWMLKRNQQQYGH